MYLNNKIYGPKHYSKFLPLRLNQNLWNKKLHENL